MGPIWGRQDPGGPHVGHINFAGYLSNMAAQTVPNIGLFQDHIGEGNGEIEDIWNILQV